MRQNAQRYKTRKERMPPAKTYRFDARLNEAQKLLIQRAADLEGRTHDRLRPLQRQSGCRTGD